MDNSFAFGLVNNIFHYAAHRLACFVVGKIGLRVEIGCMPDTFDSFQLKRFNQTIRYKRLHVVAGHFVS